VRSAARLRQYFRDYRSKQKDEQQATSVPDKHQSHATRYAQRWLAQLLAGGDGNPSPQTVTTAPGDRATHYPAVGSALKASHAEHAEQLPFSPAAPSPFEALSAVPLSSTTGSAAAVPSPAVVVPNTCSYEPGQRGDINVSRHRIRGLQRPDRAAVHHRVF
jgi:hypothetical protein